MNKKIFTLLASALMLFSTAFTANAQIIGGNLAVGDTVRTLPLGKSLGMYHIRIDSICVDDGFRAASGGNPAYFDAPTWEAVGNRGGAPIYQWDEYAPASVHGITTPGDTIVVGVTEGGRVVPVSISDLRGTGGRTNNATYTDLQSVMWCTDVEEAQYYGQWPTFHFTNKVFAQDLDFKAGTKYISGENKGWMFSNAYDNGQLNYSRPIYRHTGLDDGKYTVLCYNFGDSTIYSKVAQIDSFTNRTVLGMLKFTIVEVAPLVLTEGDFNTRLGETPKELQQLSFDPAPNSTIFSNYFGMPLQAKKADPNNYHPAIRTRTVDAAAHFGQYLNLYVNGNPDSLIYNVHRGNKDNNKNNDDWSTSDVEEDSARYTNETGLRHIQILADGKYDKDYDNNAYRLVYFPSRDSLVINAFSVGHLDNTQYTDDLYVDDQPYRGDDPGEHLYHGLYSKRVHDALIVRIQDITGLGSGSRLMTIGIHPANTRISFGISGCQNIEIDAWLPDEGVYTIWDDRGRCLGVRIYNGSIAPQWIQLEDGECPDRIPSYQWVIQKSEDQHYNHRVNISNREFGNEDDLLVSMKNVLIKSGRHQIFKHMGQFQYSPLVQDLDGYTPITNGWVYGNYVGVEPQADCDITETSGFRPVNNAYVSDKYLGYKHFYVNTDRESASFGKSDDVAGMNDMTEKGMDYNAFAFNYYHYISDENYLDLKSNYVGDDTLLHVNKTKGVMEGFQFRLGTTLRLPANDYATEKYGWPKEATTFEPTGHHQDVPVLERYYYEIKVADYYDYRDQLTEEFIILKGAYQGDVDVNNKLKYGVANTLADYEPYKIANFYLRESYFLPKTMKANEERKYQDLSRRVYYAVLQRLDEEQIQRLNVELQVSDIVKNHDESSKAYCIVAWGVDDANEWIKAQGKGVSSVRVSTFALENMNYPLYRRLCSIEDDGAVNNGEGFAMPYDAPKTLRFYTQKNNREYLFEDALSAESANHGINFLGLANADQFKEDYIAPDGFQKFNYNIFVDTAYINRGTGWIKPQYLLAVGAEIVESKEVVWIDDCGDEQQGTLLPYIRARYLINATDSAREIGSNGANMYPKRDERYIWDVTWDRLAFVDAIHVDDRLYIVSELKKYGIADTAYIVKAKDGNQYVNGAALRAMTEKGGVLHNAARRPLGSNSLGAYYDFEEWQNYHNDVTFSLRFTEKYARNASEFTGLEGTDNDSKRFWIESETTNRNIFGNRKIAPVQGGWVKIENGVPVISRTSYEDGINQGEIFNVEKPKENAVATGNEPASSKVVVAPGVGEVSILNASGKNLTITNMLGQTVVSKVLDSDNVTVDAPKGMVVVAIQGEKAVKSIVK